MAKDIKTKDLKTKDVPMEELGKEDSQPHICPICEGYMEYDGVGHYICPSCGVQDLDDFGRVREYLYEHGMTGIEEISEATEVPVEKIQEFIDEGRFELVLHCAQCGAEIKRGMYCSDCRKRTFMDLSNAMHHSEKEQQKSGHGKMYNSYTRKTGHHQYLRIKD